MPHTLLDYQTEKVTDNWLVVSKLGSGWAAVHMVMVQRKDGTSYPDVQNTGFGRYATAEEAIREAKEWSVAEELRFNEEEAKSHAARRN